MELLNSHPDWPLTARPYDGCRSAGRCRRAQTGGRATLVQEISLPRVDRHSPQLVQLARRTLRRPSDTPRGPVERRDLAFHIRVADNDVPDVVGVDAGRSVERTTPCSLELQTYRVRRHGHRPHFGHMLERGPWFLQFGSPVPASSDQGLPRCGPTIGTARYAALRLITTRARNALQPPTLPSPAAP